MVVVLIVLRYIAGMPSSATILVSAETPLCEVW